MSVKKKSKDHLKEHASATLAALTVAPSSDDPLRFWTSHPTDATLLDLRPFAFGELEKSHPNGPKVGLWGGPFSGRPQLIAELASTVEARCALVTAKSAGSYLHTLRVWWRLFDHIEAALTSNSSQLTRVESVAHLNELHEAAAHQRGVNPAVFGRFLLLANDARRLIGLPALLWSVPKASDPVRILIPEDQARELRIALKQEWERVRRTWARNDAILAEADKRRAFNAVTLGETEERLLQNLMYYQRIQQLTSKTLPTKSQILANWEFKKRLSDPGYQLGVTRSVLFPTLQEAEIAFHLALMNSGWNPSTLAKVDATSPFLVTDHPKDDKQLVLSASLSEAATLKADKARAKGKTQFCTGLRKHTSSSPVIVAMYLERTASLRAALNADLQEASAELARLQATGKKHPSIEKQYKRVLELRQGCSSVWLYVDRQNKIKWLSGMGMPRHERKDTSKTVTFLMLLLERINAGRAHEGKQPIPSVTPSDFRDIYSRWVYVHSGGNIISVMLALGHSSLKSTGRYLDNNVFSAENDEAARKFIGHLFTELERGRVDLTILAHLMRHGSLTPEMEGRLTDYRQLLRSRLGAGCADPRHPPAHVAPRHVDGRLCGPQRCIYQCPHARFLPESVDGIAMRVEELSVMSEQLPRETWLRGGFQDEHDEAEATLASLYSPKAVAEAREKWRERIVVGRHVIPGLGHVALLERSSERTGGATDE